MQKYTTDQVVDSIIAEEKFEAVFSDYSFYIKIEDYVPYVCGAVHDGHQFRKELWENCLHTEYERWYEEDPETKTMVQSHPIVIAGRDSRFEYDLNRAPETAIYEDAWGKKLWKESLPNSQKEKSLLKHQEFYRVVNALIKKLEQKFGVIVVYDMHSYNWKRWDREVPTWNLGTVNIDNQRFKEIIESWRLALATVKLPYNIKSNAKINDTFNGNGYFLKYISSHFNNTLVLATEISKIYCDELRQIIFPEIVASVECQLRDKLKAHALEFYNTHSK